jgi:hypothetical protein
MENIVIGFAVIIVIFIFITFLVIFAPKKQNFFKYKQVFPNGEIDTIINDEKLIKNISENLNIKLNNDILFYDIENDNDDEEKNQSLNTKDKFKWNDCKNNDIIEGDVKYIPILLNEKLYSENYHCCNELFDKLSKYNNIRSVFFIKLGSYSGIKKHEGFAPLTNNTLRFIYCFNSFSFNEKDCGLWVYGECKKFFKGINYLFDASKEHSIYNNTEDENIVFLIIDIERPKTIKKGVSNNEIKMF